MKKQICWILAILVILSAFVMVGYGQQGVPDLINEDRIDNNVPAEPVQIEPLKNARNSITVPLIPDMDLQGPFVYSDGLIEWGNGCISFDLLQSMGNDSVPMNAIVASVSYYSKDGKTAEEVKGWNVIVNGHEELPVYCECWYTFPDGGQTNYTNTVFSVLTDGISQVRLVPVLSADVDANRYPDIVGILSE